MSFNIAIMPFQSTAHTNSNRTVTQKSFTNKFVSVALAALALSSLALTTAALKLSEATKDIALTRFEVLTKANCGNNYSWNPDKCTWAAEALKFTCERVHEPKHSYSGYQLIAQEPTLSELIECDKPNFKTHIVGRFNEMGELLEGVRREGTFNFSKDYPEKEKEGVSSLTYEGERLAGKFHGFGTLSLKEEKYDGIDIKNETPLAQRRLLETFSSVLRNAMWQEDMVTGYVTDYHSNGAVNYKGFALNNLAHGFGTRSYLSDGSKLYEGEFAEGMKSGLGTLSHNGVVHYKGLWLNDQRNGFGKAYQKDGSIAYAGMWVDDKKHGLGISYLERKPTLYNWENDIPKGIVDPFVYSEPLDNIYTTNPTVYNVEMMEQLIYEAKNITSNKFFLSF